MPLSKVMLPVLLWKVTGAVQVVASMSMLPVPDVEPITMVPAADIGQYTASTAGYLQRPRSARHADGRDWLFGLMVTSRWF